MLLFVWRASTGGQPAAFSVAYLQVYGLMAVMGVVSILAIQALNERGVWAFTIGTAALDGVLVEGGSLDDQLRCALDAAAAVVWGPKPPHLPPRRVMPRCRAPR